MQDAFSLAAMIQDLSCDPTWKTPPTALHNLHAVVKDSPDAVFLWMWHGLTRRSATVCLYGGRWFYKNCVSKLEMLTPKCHSITYVLVLEKCCYTISFTKCVTSPAWSQGRYWTVCWYYIHHTREVWNSAGELCLYTRAVFPPFFFLVAIEFVKVLHAMPFFFSF